MPEFQGFPKIPRLNKPIVITEKIDGTNGCVVVEQIPYEAVPDTPEDANRVVVDNEDYEARDVAPYWDYFVYAQSRSRIITPKEDNHGFAAWVWDNAAELVKVLGPGRHFGEWWGSGINRGYDLPKGEKRFSLFNTKRWSDVLHPTPVTSIPELRRVPVLDHGNGFDDGTVVRTLCLLQMDGSVAAPGFDNPEGVIVYHAAANQPFKVLLDGDDQPKSVAAGQAVGGQVINLHLGDAPKGGGPVDGFLQREAVRRAMERRAQNA